MRLVKQANEYVRENKNGNKKDDKKLLKTTLKEGHIILYTIHIYFYLFFGFYFSFPMTKCSDHMHCILKKKQK